MRGHDSVQSNHVTLQCFRAHYGSMLVAALFVMIGRAVDEEISPDVKRCSFRRAFGETCTGISTVCSPPTATRPTVTTTSSSCRVTVSPNVPAKPTARGSSSRTCVPFRAYCDLLLMVTVYVKFCPA